MGMESHSYRLAPKSEGGYFFAKVFHDDMGHMTHADPDPKLIGDTDYIRDTLREMMAGCDMPPLSPDDFEELVRRKPLLVRKGATKQP
jgi:hypothetical protein